MGNEIKLSYPGNPGNGPPRNAKMRISIQVIFYGAERGGGPGLKGK